MSRKLRVVSLKLQAASITGATAKPARRLLAGTHAGAQTQTPQAAPAAPAETQFGEEEKVVVTGRKREEALQKLPAPSTVLGGDQLDATQATTADQVLHTVPGALTTPFGAEYASDVIIRGAGAGRWHSR